MKHCPHCSQPVPRGVKICPECGRPLKRSAQRTTAQPSSSFEMPVQPKSGLKRAANLITCGLIAIVIMCVCIFSVIVLRKIQPNHVHHFSGQDGIVTEPPGSGQSGSSKKVPEGEITYLDSEMVRDVSGDDVLVVRLQFQNNGDANRSYSGTYRAKVFQDGVSCQETFVDTGDEFMNDFAEVQPGASVTVKSAFIVTPGKPVQLTVGDFLGTFTVLDITITPEEAPAGSSKKVPEGEITYLDSEMVRDVFGNDVLVVRLQFQNNGDANRSYSGTYRAKVFQDGVSCRETFVDTGDELTNDYAEVQPGASVTVKSAFIVTPGEPAQLTVGDYLGTFTVLDMTITPEKTPTGAAV